MKSVSTRFRIVMVVHHPLLLDFIGGEESCVGSDHVHLVGGQDVDGSVNRGPGDVEDKMDNVRCHHVQVLFRDGPPGAFLHFQPFKRDVYGGVPRDVV